MLLLISSILMLPAVVRNALHPLHHCTTFVITSFSTDLTGCQVKTMLNTFIVLSSWSVLHLHHITSQRHEDESCLHITQAVLAMSTTACTQMHSLWHRWSTVVQSIAVLFKSYDSSICRCFSSTLLWIVSSTCATALLLSESHNPWQ